MPDPATTDRVALARRIIDFGTTPEDLAPRQLGRAAAGAPRLDLRIGWPDGLEPVPAPLPEEPATDDPLPRADYVVITWTAAELEALADVLTPGVNGRRRWYRYDRRMEEYLPNIRGGAPARSAGRLASYHPTRIGTRSVLCMKSELHLNQDGVRTGPGTATLPVADLFRQIIEEVKPKVIITVGTAGGTFGDHQLGDVVITRGAKFRLTQEFAAEPFASTAYRSPFRVPKKHLDTAVRLMGVSRPHLVEPDFGPPSIGYDFDGPLIPGVRNDPDIKLDGRDFERAHPMLTTDFFEFGNTANRLDEHGCGVEMGDAALGMVCDELGDDAPAWLVIRNVSDPLINAELPTSPVDMQAHWAVWYYETFGYWTSVNSAIATWAMIAR